jgi:hypothetical protein
MKSRHLSRLVLALLLALVAGGVTRAGTATDITGLYYTGVDNNGVALNGGVTDPHWNVTYASTNGGSSKNTAYQGAAYVVSASYVDAAWTQNTSSSKWITAPGASTSSTGGTTNAGGDYLPGNGNTGSNEGIFIYTLAFTIVGTGSGTVTNAVSISLTLSADDEYKVYINPSGNGTSIPTGTAAATATNAWNNTTSVTLANGTNGTGTSGNSVFKVGTNYLTIVVDNTNSVSGSSTSTAFNPSGLLLYQMGSATLINGKPIPEMGTVLPVIGAILTFGVSAWRRSRRALLP